MLQLLALRLPSFASLLVGDFVGPVLLQPVGSFVALLAMLGLLAVCAYGVSQRQTDFSLELTLPKNRSLVSLALRFQHGSSSSFLQDSFATRAKYFGGPYLPFSVRFACLRCALV